MTQIKLSPLAEKLFSKLNSISHIISVETAALALSEDGDVSPADRIAYYEIHEYCQNNY